jgi:hypothetical protein
MAAQNRHRGLILADKQGDRLTQSDGTSFTREAVLRDSNCCTQRVSIAHAWRTSFVHKATSRDRQTVPEQVPPFRASSGTQE